MKSIRCASTKAAPPDLRRTLFRVPVNPLSKLRTRELEVSFGYSFHAGGDTQMGLKEVKTDSSSAVNMNLQKKCSCPPPARLIAVHP